ncbi:MAG: endonuclease III [Deinococcota bacterium]
MPRESLASKRTRAVAILEQLRQDFPEAKTELSFRTPFQLLISTILSAQATDVSVNAATPPMFAQFPDASAMAKTTPEVLEPFIRTIGLYRNKAKNCVAAAQKLVSDYGGEVPNDFDALVTLPGVGRKTANVVLASAFGRPAIAVDTHVGRLARRMKLSKHDNPDKVEADLEKLLPEEDWIFAHHALILHGRRVCNARTPKCSECSVCELCPSCAVPS